MKEFLLYLKWPVLIVSVIIAFVLAINGLVYLTFYYHTFHICFMLISIGVIVLGFKRLLTCSYCPSDREGWDVVVAVSMFLFGYILVLGPLFAGSYFVEPTDDGTVIKHRIFPYKSREVLRCKEARDLGIHPIGDNCGHQYFEVKDIDGKIQIYDASPYDTQLKPKLPE